MWFCVVFLWQVPLHLKLSWVSCSSALALKCFLLSSIIYYHDTHLFETSFFLFLCQLLWNLLLWYTTHHTSFFFPNSRWRNLSPGIMLFGAQSSLLTDPEPLLVCLFFFLFFICWWLMYRLAIYNNDDEGLAPKLATFLNSDVWYVSFFFSFFLYTNSYLFTV